MRQFSGRRGRLSFVPPNRSAPVSLLAEDRADVLEFRINGKHGDQVRPRAGPSSLSGGLACWSGERRRRRRSGHIAAAEHVLRSADNCEQRWGL